MRKRVALACLAVAVSLPAATVGVVDFPVSARKPETQACFNRAVAMLHNFWFEEAREQFEACAAGEPGFQMAWWGVAMTYNHSLWNRVWPEEARAALAKLDAGQEVTARERLYLGAVKTLFGEGKKKERERAYAKAMGAIAKAYPDDLEAASFHSLALIAIDDRMRAGAIALDVYAKQPEHPGAAHYIIHAFDDPEHAILALPAARRYAKIAPEAHHARHMPSHIFLQLGMWDDTVASNEDCWAASVAWQTRKKLSYGLRDYHSQYWLAYAYLQQGRYADAWKVWEKKREDIIASQGNGDTYRYWADLGAAIVIGAGAWERAEEVFRDPVTIRVGTGEGHAHAPAPAARALEGLTRGLVAARQGQDISVWVDKIEQAKTMADKNGNAVGAARMEAQALMVKAEQARRQQRVDEALAMLERAHALEEKEKWVSGPPDIVKPSHEMAGEILLEAGKAKEALAKFQRALERQPNRSLSVWGAWKAAERMGETELAATYRSALDVNWAKADKKLGGAE
jgi:tetratricopeptide (TPR) repeat protein